MRQRRIRRAALLAAALALPVAGLTLAAATAAFPGGQEPAPGYDDTPYLPDSPWRVHDRDRPRPPVVTPGTASTQDRAGAPPSDAVVLFDGTGLASWESAEREGPAGWEVQDGWFQVNGTGDIRTRQHFGDCQVHVEFCAPPPRYDSQGRGNSGVFLMGRYEVQVLDNHENPTYADGHAAGLYGQHPPAVNACRPPGQWQTYDIVFEAPRFQGTRLLRPARATVLHNGVLVHHRRAFLGETCWRSVPRYLAHSPRGPIWLQDHGSPVRYRNLWVRPLAGLDREG